MHMNNSSVRSVACLFSNLLHPEGDPSTEYCLDQVDQVLSKWPVLYCCIQNLLFPVPVGYDLFWLRPLPLCVSQTDKVIPILPFPLLGQTLVKRLLSLL